MKYFLLFLTAIMLIAAGCSKRPGPGEEARGPETMWETVWVDPQIVSNDQLYTLIYSTRIDSVRLDGDMPLQAPGIRFELPPEGCIVTINLRNTAGQVVRPLVVRRLPAGHYKLTLTRLPAREAGLPPGWYSASVEFCGQELRTELYLQ